MASKIMAAVMIVLALLTCGCGALSVVEFTDGKFMAHGPATTHSQARYSDATFNVNTRHADPHYMQVRGGTFVPLTVLDDGTVLLEPADDADLVEFAESEGDEESEDAGESQKGVDLLLQGSGPYRAVIADTPLGVLVLYGGDDFEAEGVSYTRTESAESVSITFGIARIGGKLSVVYAELRMIVEAVYPDAWGRLTDAEKEARIETIKALRDTGMTLIDAIKTVFMPVPIP